MAECMNDDELMTDDIRVSQLGTKIHLTIKHYTLFSSKKKYSYYASIMLNAYQLCSKLCLSLPNW